MLDEILFAVIGIMAIGYVGVFHMFFRMLRNRSLEAANTIQEIKAQCKREEQQMYEDGWNDGIAFRDGGH